MSLLEESAKDGYGVPGTRSMDRGNGELYASGGGFIHAHIHLRIRHKIDSHTLNFEVSR